MNRPVKVIYADGTYKIMRYDVAGNLVAETDELGRATRYVYDLRNRLIITIRPDGTVVRTHYNGGGRVESTTDAEGYTTTYTYDKLGRVTQKTLPDPDGDGSLTESATKYYYNTQGNLQYVVNALGSTYTDTAHTTTYTYNKLGQVLTETQPDPDGTSGSLARPVTTYTYDANGNLLTVTDALGHVTTYYYDEHDRKIMVKETFLDGTGTTTYLYTWYYYDNNGNLTYMVDSAGATSSRPTSVTSLTNYTYYTTQYVYDHDNRKIQENPSRPGRQRITDPAHHHLRLRPRR